MKLIDFGCCILWSTWHSLRHVREYAAAYLAPIPVSWTCPTWYSFEDLLRPRACQKLFICRRYHDFKFSRAISKPNLKSHLSAGWCLRLTPRPPRAPKAHAHGFSVHFGLKHTLRCVIWVKSWKLDALIWTASGVNVQLSCPMWSSL